MNTLAFIPSPSAGEIYLGPVPLRGYALCIILGVFLAVWLGGRRWVARGGQAGTVADIAVWAVPFGLVGGRLYHVITDYQLYFGEGRNWVDAFRIWDGGLGIWGAVALGAVGAWIGCRRRGIPLPAWADALAPGLALAQAVGRWGNWFNQELYGRATDLPWAVEIAPGNRPLESPDLATYHPTFLYESLWCLGAAALIMWADRRFRMGHGRVFALYVAVYTVGRFWIEYLRIDDAHEVLGLRLNNWTSVVVFLGAVAYIVVSHRRAPGREKVVEPAALESAEAADTDPTAAKDASARSASAKGTPSGEDASADVASDADDDTRADRSTADGTRRTTKKA
ncbi:prolipoprotein diacylglyceryl transferase [Streptomyces oceani]|uniref:Phosphatidylglycerol--prolipoprotein diacylglyceryl transferase n=1 Tax=Streptomyces oceani TaxID=1075402 RepID=A0A1E7JZH7_9ACTN|nr:prolipoprotein diacylglyceryl transferase [Streptomyces oceani]OEU97015.1 prolipoprotein diacylglyceryl transferase [Streptomyces oceani]